MKKAFLWPLWPQCLPITPRPWQAKLMVLRGLFSLTGVSSVTR